MSVFWMLPALLGSYLLCACLFIHSCMPCNITYFFYFMHVSYLIGCDNELAKLHTSNPDACDKVGGVIIMHIDDLRKFALLWLHKTEEVRADTAHYGKNLTGDIYESGWISEMYGYSFGAAEVYFICHQVLA